MQRRALKAGDGHRRKLRCRPNHASGVVRFSREKRASIRYETASKARFVMITRVYNCEGLDVSNPAFPDPSNAGEHLRTLESERYAQQRPGLDDGLGGVREYSKAWQMNESTAYLLRKSWADPVSRIIVAAALSFIAAIWAFLLFF